VTLHITDQKLYNNFDFVLKAQLHAESKHLPNHGRFLQGLLHVVEFLANRYKLDFKGQQALGRSRKNMLENIKQK